MPCQIIGQMKGLKGDRGPRGNKGDKGDPGEQGPQGLPGPKGSDANADTPTQVLEKLKNVDGQGSGLDADTLDGYSSEVFAKVDSVTPLLSVEKVQLHSAFTLVKWGQIVTLNIYDWKVGNRATGSNYTGLTIPDGFAPTQMIFMAPSLVSENGPQRVDGLFVVVHPDGPGWADARTIKVNVPEPLDEKRFYGHAMWITEE